MIIDAIEIGAKEKKWAERTSRIYRMCRKLLAEIGSDEWEWAPEEGVPSIRDHACSILKNAEAFLFRLSGGRVEKHRTKGNIAGARSVADRLGEIDVVVRRLLTTDVAKLSEPSETAAGPSRDPAEIDELCFTHVTGVVQSTAYLQSLRRLIDPTRVPITL
jgi:hypothetical protein